MRRLLVRVILALMALPVAALIIGFGGSIHPVGDSFAVFRLPLALAVAGLALLLVLLGARWRGAATLAMAAGAFVTTLPPATSGPSGGQVVRVYQKNLLVLLSLSKELVADIRSSGADIVTLQEVHERALPVLETLRDLYPYQTYCPPGYAGGQAVLSKFPGLGPELPCDGDRAMAGMLVDTGRHRVWAVSVHMRWPWPYGQSEQVTAVSKLLATLDEPVIMGGDFNMVPWAESIASIARAGSMLRAGQAGPSFKLPDLPLSIPIDHVLMPEGSRAARAELRDRFGSDHEGVLARFELP